MINSDIMHLTMEDHIVEGTESLCKRLEINFDSLVSSLVRKYGDKAGIIVGFIALGADIERKRSQWRERNGYDREPVASQDEFLSSLPENDVR